MLKIIHILLDLVFPPRGSEELVKRTQTSDVLYLYKPHFVQRVVSLAPYQHPVVKSLIKENKFHHNHTAATLLSKLIDHWLVAFSQQRVLLIPIPLGKKRQRERGYNQVTEILRKLKTIDITIDESLLTRTLDTKAQTELSREERLKNMTNAFACNVKKVSELQNTIVVVVDDVLTTGATFSAAQAALAPHLHPSCSLICLAIAH